MTNNPPFILKSFVFINKTNFPHSQLILPSIKPVFLKIIKVLAQYVEQTLIVSVTHVRIFQRSTWQRFTLVVGIYTDSVYLFFVHSGVQRIVREHAIDGQRASNSEFHDFIFHWFCVVKDHRAGLRLFRWWGRFVFWNMVSAQVGGYSSF